MAPQAVMRLVQALAKLRPAASAPLPLPLTEDWGSWLIYAPQWWPLAEDEFESVWSTRPETRLSVFLSGKSYESPRWAQAYGHDYRFSGQRSTAKSWEESPTPVQSVWRSISRHPETFSQNAALVNYYLVSSKAEGPWLVQGDAERPEKERKPFADRIGSHSDDEKEAISRSPIFSHMSHPIFPSCYPMILLNLTSSSSLEHRSSRFLGTLRRITRDASASRPRRGSKG